MSQKLIDNWRALSKTLQAEGIPLGSLNVGEENICKGELGSCTITLENETSDLILSNSINAQQAYLDSRLNLKGDPEVLDWLWRFFVPFSKSRE